MVLESRRGGASDAHRSGLENIFLFFLGGVRVKSHFPHRMKEGGGRVFFYRFLMGTLLRK